MGRMQTINYMAIRTGMYFRIPFKAPRYRAKTINTSVQKNQLYATFRLNLAPSEQKNQLYGEQKGNTLINVRTS